MSFVFRTGKLFEVGSWPEKKFSMSKQELEKAVKSFHPVDFDVEHRKTVFDGHLGGVTKIWVDGNNLMAQYALAKPIAELFQGKTIPVSATWSKKNKSLLKVALTHNPAIADASAQVNFSVEEEDMSLRDKWNALFTKIEEEIGKDDESTKTEFSADDVKKMVQEGLAAQKAEFDKKLEEVMATSKTESVAFKVEKMSDSMSILPSQKELAAKLMEAAPDEFAAFVALQKDTLAKLSTPTQFAETELPEEATAFVAELVKSGVSQAEALSQAFVKFGGSNVS